MSKEKQIEEMAKVIVKEDDTCRVQKYPKDFTTQATASRAWGSGLLKI